MREKGWSEKKREHGMVVLFCIQGGASAAPALAKKKTGNEREEERKIWESGSWRSEIYSGGRSRSFLVSWTCNGRGVRRGKKRKRERRGRESEERGQDAQFEEIKKKKKKNRMHQKTILLATKLTKKGEIIVPTLP